MLRIRTVKPEIYKHEDLHTLEIDTGWPMIRLFIGLFSVADREGRFKWRPKAIKSDIAPYDDINFEHVLDAFASRGFVVHYANKGELYGAIPTFKKHQVINNKEKPSQLPGHEHEDSKIITVNFDLPARPPRVTNARRTPLRSTQGEGNGKGTGREREGNGKTVSSKPTKAGAFIAGYRIRFASRWNTGIDISPKDSGIAKRVAESLSFEKIEIYLDAFFQMPDTELIKKKHPVYLFEAKLTEIAVFAQSGEFTSWLQARQAEQSHAFREQVRAIDEGRL